ncbi:MAG: sigma-70 family RNA polymerase sigma factor [Oscillospiraceae bacterium]|nr:sigma-70 family RNA polymerase sigma factor [Oscillospiraceae bacterium]
MPENTAPVYFKLTAFLQTVIQSARLNYLRSLPPDTVSLDEMFIEPSVEFETIYDSFYPKTGFEFEEERLSEAFASLPLIRQRILELTYIDELSANEIAQRLNCSVKCVYNQRYWALDKLRR